MGFYSQSVSLLLSQDTLLLRVQLLATAHLNVERQEKLGCDELTQGESFFASLHGAKAAIHLD